MTKNDESELSIEELVEEVFGYVTEVTNLPEDGSRIHSNYKTITAYAMRLQEIHNMIALEEITGRADNELRRFRTMIIDPTIERFDKAAQFESRKITALQMEMKLGEKD